MKFNVFTILTPKSQTQHILDHFTIRQALEKFDVHKFTVVPVLDSEGNYINTISEGDLLRFIKNDCNFDIHHAETKRINEVGRYRPYVALDNTCEFDDLVALSLSQNFIPIIDDRKKFIGIVKRSKIIDMMRKNQ